MKSVVVFDTAIGTSNLGDEIILQCIEEEMDFLLRDSFIMRFGTHVKNFEKKRFLLGSQKIDFSYDADYKLVMGTNLLSRDIKDTQAQWPIKKLDSYLYDNCIMVGVGNTLPEGKTTKYSQKIYKRILRPDMYHSVRDEICKKMLEDMGFKVLNTGCPTLWKFTPEFCKEIPTKKASRVIFSLSGYRAQRNTKFDRMLIDVLRNNYKEIYYWVQTSQDEIYLDQFEGVEDIPRIYSLERYGELLDEGDIDYVGTRLHGGVYAMHHKVRSIVIAIDHRARGFHDVNNLVICERRDIPTKLNEMINSEFETDIRIPLAEIEQFKAQFKQDREKPVQHRHEKLLYIRCIRFGKKIMKKCIKFSRKVKRKLSDYKWRFDKIFKKSRNKKIAAEQTIQKGQVMFYPFQGEYTCNLKYIAEELKKRDGQWNQVWVTLKQPNIVADLFPEDVKLVKANTPEFYEELGKSQILVDNAFNFPKCAFKKKPGQTYFETMHGSLGIKKIGPDVVPDRKRNKRGFLCGKMTDYAISNSSFETMVYETSFWKRDKIVELGHARNDIFFAEEEKLQEIRDKVYGYYHIDPSAKLALFAPTFENENDAGEVEKETIDFNAVREALEKKFGGVWYILDRAHHSSFSNREVRNGERVLNADYYPDIQELMIAVDVGITDYSSWIYDYVLTRKAGFLYTPDLDSYDHNRGFYYPIQETPFPIGCSNKELIEEIMAFDEENFRKEVERFLNDRGCIDDGHASEKIVDLMEKVAYGE